MRLAILSHVLPPSPSGQAVVLFRILSQVDPHTYYLIKSENDSGQIPPPSNGAYHLEAQFEFLPAEPKFNPAGILGFFHLHNIANMVIRTWTRVRNLLAIVRRSPETSGLIACTGNLIDVPAGFIACRIARIPFYIYLFDDYVYQWIGLQRVLARIISPYIFKHSAGLIGPNEFICAEYQRRYNVTPWLVRNPCDEAELEIRNKQPWPAERGKVKIIYTGAIYHANFDCFRNLLAAMESLQDENLELHVYTAQTREELAGQGIRSQKLFLHAHVQYDEVRAQQDRADILFLPLAFQSPIPEVIRSSAPGKMGEYLATGRPILAHIPADSFVAYYFNKHQCGWVVDQDDARALARTLKNLLIDEKTRATYSLNAQRQARIDFSPLAARQRFLEFMRKTA